MLFRVYQKLTGKWFLYDNIRLTKTKYFEKWPENPKAVYDAKNFVNLLPKDSTSEVGITQVELIFKDGPIKTVVLQTGKGYLMNDEGKTIERL